MNTQSKGHRTPLVLNLFLLIRVSILSLSVAGDSAAFVQLLSFSSASTGIPLHLLACLLHILASPPHFLQLLALFLMDPRFLVKTLLLHFFLADILIIEFYLAYLLLKFKSMMNNFDWPAYA